MSRFAAQSQDSVLFVTLDSCRFDTFASAHAPNMKAVAPLHMAQAPSHYTYGSHSAMFVGFTPGIADVKQAYLNPKFGKLFKLVGPGFGGKGTEAYSLEGRNIVEGFAKLGFATIGAGAMAWFDPSTETGQHLSQSFQRFFYPGPYHLAQQLDWIAAELRAAQDAGTRDTFVFLNVGETHVPYWFDGAPWPASDNPCWPFQEGDRSADCRSRQRMCCEYADRALGPLLDAFARSTVVLCGDHGDCWGEDNLWEHGISHPATLTVPLLAKVRGIPVQRDPSLSIASGRPPSHGGSDPTWQGKLRSLLNRRRRDATVAGRGGADGSTASGPGRA